MPALVPVQGRVTVDGKFFRCGAQKYYVKGVTYGPFAPDETGSTFGTPERAARDFRQIAELGANTLRVYYVPPRWFLDLAGEHGLRVFVDIPWPKHLCFLDDQRKQAAARSAVRDAVTACKGHAAVFAFSVVNEVPAEIARWSGPERVERFIEELVDEAKAIDPDCLCTFASYPPTEFLRPQNIDFLCFNVYLHHRPSFEAYLARLQTLADARPLMLGELGMDSWREGEPAKCRFLAGQIESAFRCGLAGTVIFSFTDEWFRGGHLIEDWSFGLTERDRKPKDSFRAVQDAYRVAPHFSLPRTPRVSVVVASYNGASTLATCLDSLGRLHYPDYEVILVDDGSTDNTPQIAERYPSVRQIRQPNLGLSAARNTGIHAATGEIVAFTDSDCRVDEDWLYYLVSDLLRSDFAGMGGHNFLPPEDSPTAAAVMASPGGPAHVMLTDREAEHIPGCNMAFYKWALDEIHGFDPIFRKAGDDVDVCWRLQNCGHKLGFSAAGFVWHYRRSTVRAYLKQQAGYGEAEALLARKHPEFFNLIGGGIWRGRIYSAARFGLLTQRPVIYHGLFGSGFFQKLYTPDPASAVMLLTSLPWHLFVTLPALIVSLHFATLFPLGLATLALSLGICVVSGAQADLPRRKCRWWSRPLVAFLFFLQPVVRGWARYRSTWAERAVAPNQTAHSLDDRPIATGESLAYWAGKRGFDRFAFLNELVGELRDQRLKPRLDSGWSAHDVELGGGTWVRLWLSSVTEELEEGRKIFRCRLRTAWTVRARLAFLAALGSALALTGALGYLTEWIWMLPITLPLLYLFLENESRRTRGVVSEIISRLAAKSELLPVTSATDSPPARP